MRIFIFDRKFFFFVLMGIMVGLGFWFSRIIHLQAVTASPKKEVAIVIDDFGGRAKGIQAMMELPYKLTFAVMPFEEFSYQQAEQAVNKGFEIIIHMPFEAFNADPSWYGRKYISINSSPLEIKQLIAESFQILPMAVGLSNHMGSKATADSKIMNEVFKELQRNKSFYLDSGTTFTVSPASQIASGLNLPSIKRDVFLDNSNSIYEMRRQLGKLFELARTSGSAVGIGHVGQTGIALAELLRKELPKYQKEGFHLVPLSELVYSQVLTRPYQNKNIVIGIDPGHGGIDSGTKWGKMLEKDLNLKFSFKMVRGLIKKGYRVVLTRNNDHLLTPLAHYSNKNCPYKRDDFHCRIQKLEAAHASVIVSIHVNWSKLAYHRGPIVYYSSSSPVSQKIAQHVQEHFNQIQPYRKLAKKCNYYLLEQADTPAILIELGFFSNREDRRLLQDDHYLERLNAAIIDGLSETL